MGTVGTVLLNRCKGVFLTKGVLISRALETQKALCE